MAIAAAAWLAAAPAQALTLKTFDFRLNAYSSGVSPIQGSITFDLDLLPANYPLGPIPSAVKALTLQVPISNPADQGTGTYTLSDFSGFEWKTNGIGLDFNQDLVGQGGWGTSCSTASPTDCSFRLISNDPNTSNTPTSDYPFQFFARGILNADAIPPPVAFGVYYGLATFVPAASNSAAPAPLPLLGGIAALGWSRRLRQRRQSGC